MTQDNNMLYIALGVFLLVVVVILAKRRRDKKHKSPPKSSYQMMGAENEGGYQGPVMQSHGNMMRSSNGNVMQSPQGFGQALPNAGNMQYLTFVDGSGNQQLRIKYALGYDASNNVITADAKRAYNLIGGTAGSIVYQNNDGSTTFLDPSNAQGRLLGFKNGQPIWENPTDLTVGKATNLEGGVAGKTGQLVYQDGQGNTRYLSPDQADGKLLGFKDGSPIWQVPSQLSVDQANSAGYLRGTTNAGYIPTSGPNGTSTSWVNPTDLTVGNATNASLAALATRATNADNASLAALATRATNADNASLAALATRATNADNASLAALATRATNADNDDFATKINISF
jgi:hypothetical protein